MTDDNYTIADLHVIDGKSFIQALRLLDNGNARSTMSFYPIADLSSDDDILSSYDAAIARWHEIGVVDDLPYDEKALLSNLSDALAVKVTARDLDRSSRVTVTHEIDEHVIRITAVRRDKRGREAKQWKARLPEGDQTALAAAIRKGAAYAQTLEGDPFE